MKNMFVLFALLLGLSVPQFAQARGAAALASPNSAVLSPNTDIFYSTSQQVAPLDFSRVYSKSIGRASYAPQNAYGINLDPKYLPKFRKCLSNVVKGAGRCMIVRVGDSTTIGINGSGVANWPNQGTYLASILTANGIPAYQDGYFGDSETASGGRHLIDSRISIGSWQNFAAHYGLGGLVMSSSSAGTPYTFTPYNKTDTCVFYGKNNNTAGSTATLTLGSGTPQTIDQSGAIVSMISSVTATATLGNNACVINYTGSGGQVKLYGLVAYDSTQPAVDIVDAGWWGSAAAHWACTLAGGLCSNGYYVRSLDTLLALAPDLVIIKAGINDATAGAGHLTSYKTWLQTIITAMAGTSDIILETDNPTTGNATQAVQDSYVSALYDLAISNSIPLIDSYSVWGSYTTANGLGFMSDTLHPASIGYADMARYEAAFLLKASPGGGSIASSAAPQIWTLNNSEKMRLTASGSLGIGTATPNATLAVQGTISASTGSSTNHATCWKSGGVLGYCSAVVASDGTCGTCN